MRNILFAVLVGSLCLALDNFSADVILTPLVALCWLMWVARNNDWKQVTLVFCVLTVFVAISLLGQNFGRIAVRTGSFLLAGSLAVAFSRARQRAMDTLASARAIICAVPTPIVVADLTGAITAASDESTALLPKDFAPLIGHSFADVFLGHLPPGKAMKMYLDWFHMEGTRDEMLYLRGQASAPIHARILTTGEGRDRLLVAAIQKPTG